MTNYNEIGKLVRMKDRDYLMAAKYIEGVRYLPVLSEEPDATLYGGQIALIVDCEDDEYSLYFPAHNYVRSWIHSDMFTVIGDAISGYRT